ncbi:MAG: alpha/beta fold hydrolase [Solirubrobacteraceae bacterium]
MQSIELKAGPVEYGDSAGEGPVLVLLGGLLMDGSVWEPMLAELARDHRCIVPTLPLGAHRRPMRPDADLSLDGHATIVEELLEALDLREVTLVGNDHAAAFVLAGRGHPRVARLVISSCEAFENFPPGLPGKNIRLAGHMPGGIHLSLQALRLRFVRRLPIAFGWMAKHRLPDALIDRWIAPGLADGRVRRDLRRYVTSARRSQMVEFCERLRSFRGPALIVWTPEDKVQCPEHGRRFAELLPDARLVEIADSYTLIMRDQPVRFAQAIREFVAETAASTVA